MPHKPAAAGQTWQWPQRPRWPAWQPQTCPGAQRVLEGKEVQHSMSSHQSRMGWSVCSMVCRVSRRPQVCVSRSPQLCVSRRPQFVCVSSACLRVCCVVSHHKVPRKLCMFHTRSRTHTHTHVQLLTAAAAAASRPAPPVAICSDLHPANVLGSDAPWVSRGGGVFGLAGEQQVMVADTCRHVFVRRSGSLGLQGSSR